VLLGIRYYNGDGVRTDLRQAAHWFQLAAEQGDRAAQYELGAMYQAGEGGLPRDDRRAILLYARSAQQGFEAANLVLGIDYELGDGIPRSRSQAIANLQRAGHEGLFVANALAAADTPTRLDGALALGNFLAAIRGSPLPMGWDRSAAPRRRAGEPVTLAAVLGSKRHDEKSSTK
jgi:TPR repeat protein